MEGTLLLLLLVRLGGNVRATCAVSYLETRVSLPFVVIYDNLVCLYLMRYSKMILHMLGFKIGLPLQWVLLGFLSNGVAPTQN